MAQRQPIPFFTWYPILFLSVTSALTNFRDCSSHLYQVSNKRESTGDFLLFLYSHCLALELCIATLTPRPGRLERPLTGTDSITTAETRGRSHTSHYTLQHESDTPLLLTAHSLPRISHMESVCSWQGENLSILQTALITTAAPHNHCI